MSAREEPRNDRAPGVAGDVGAVSAKRPDDAGDVLDKVSDRVVLDVGRSVGKAVATHVGRDREATRAGDGIDLLKKKIKLIPNARLVVFKGQGHGLLAVLDEALDVAADFIEKNIK